MTTVLVLNGPNLHRLGTRQPDVYGTETLDDVRDALLAAAPSGVTIDLRQTNDEATLLEWLLEAADSGSPVILNPAAFTHYSYALRDAATITVQAGVPVIEVHISNPQAREEFRRTSVLSGVVTGTIAGLGTNGYLLALAHLTGGPRPPLG